MNDRLPSGRCPFAPHVPTGYAPGRFSRRCGPGAFLDGLHREGG